MAYYRKLITSVADIGVKGNIGLVSSDLVKLVPALLSTGIKLMHFQR